MIVSANSNSLTSYITKANKNGRVAKDSTVEITTAGHFLRLVAVAFGEQEVEHGGGRGSHTNQGKLFPGFY